MNGVLLERQQEIASLATQFQPNPEVELLAGQLVVAAQFGPTDSGKGFHGPLAFEEVERRIALGQLPEEMVELGVDRALQIRPFANRDMRPVVELGKPPEALPYEWYCNMEIEGDYEELRDLLATGGLCQVIAAGLRVYGTRVEQYNQRALNLVEFIGAECLRMKREEYFADFSATLLFAKRFDTWLKKVITRDGPNPPDFSVRLDEGWLAMNIARDNPELAAHTAANDYGEDGDVPAFVQLADGYLGLNGQEQADRHGINLEFLDTYYDRFGDFKQDYQANPRPLDEYARVL